MVPRVTGLLGPAGPIPFLRRHRRLLLSGVASEFRQRFSRSLLGSLWVVLNPMVQAALYALVLGSVLGSRLPGRAADPMAYPLYLLSGMLCWSLVSELVLRLLGLFVAEATLLKKASFPRFCLPLIACGSALVNHLLLMAAVLVVALVSPIGWQLSLLWLPLLSALACLFGLALGLILGCCNVFVRDLEPLTAIGLQLWFWLTPIVFVPDAVPPRLRRLLLLNPLAWLVQAFQSVLLEQQSPRALPLLASLAVGVLLALAARHVWRRTVPAMAEVL
ncbi:ABC transporter permease [Cyanobium sp. FGCU-52]|nr:ABC transporter permease [Cyanobium sp. FGCU52]